MATSTSNCRLIFVATMLLTTYYAQGQGCSDAGFCTMGAMRPDQPFRKNVAIRMRSLELTSYYGATRFDDHIYSMTADFNFSIKKVGGFQIKLPFMWVNGPLAQTSGIGDISLSFTRAAVSKVDYQINWTIGAKLPTNNASLSRDGLPLPMYYQTSLGTYDIVAGASFINRNWLVAAGIQIPLNKNGNQFLWGPWNNTEDSAAARTYTVSKDLNRGNDAMLRVERNLRFSRLNLNIGLLGIYRFTEDIISSAITIEEQLPKTKGLALTGLIGAGYRFNAYSGLRFVFGRVLIRRDKNPDGLSREVVTTISYYYNF